MVNEINETIEVVTTKTPPDLLPIIIGIVLGLVANFAPCLILNSKYKELENKKKDFLTTVKNGIIEKNSLPLKIALGFMWVTLIMVIIIVANFFSNSQYFLSNYKLFFGWFSVFFLLNMVFTIKGYLLLPNLKKISQYTDFDDFSNITTQHIKTLNYLKKNWNHIDNDFKKTIIDAVSSKLIEISD